jgi:hypothetical protein
MRDCFWPSLRGVRTLVESQIKQAGDKGYAVSKVIFSGGFSQSPSLQSWMTAHVLKEKVNIKGDKIEPVFPERW